MTACASVTATVASLTLEDAVPIAGIWLACTALMWLGWGVAR
jgi:hypothetical protein